MSWVSLEKFWKNLPLKASCSWDGKISGSSLWYYVTSIVDMKVNKEQPYVIMDGGINHLNYYGQQWRWNNILYALDAEEMRKQKVRRSLESLWSTLYSQWCGCKAFSLYKPQLHDILVFERVGAYSVTEGIYLFSAVRFRGFISGRRKKGCMVRDGVHTDLLNSEK